MAGVVRHVFICEQRISLCDEILAKRRCPRHNRD
jgi:hypothetical protein